VTLYVCSRAISVPERNSSLTTALPDKHPPLANSNQFLTRRVSSRTAGDPEFLTDFQATLAIPISPGCLFLGGQCEIFICN